MVDISIRMPLTVDWLYLPKGKSYPERVKVLTSLVADSFDIDPSELVSVASSHQWLVLSCYLNS